MKKILLILSLFWANLLYPQSEAANWYFGYGAGISFNQAQGTVESVNDGQLFTNEGCASISDSLGSLLFYTDGTTVYNKNHDVMSNGFGLYGDASSSQSAIIVPFPGNSSNYYIFTVDNPLDGENFGLNYSIVDMSQNGGLGEVTQKNSSLLRFCSEKITVVQKDCITGSFWLVTFASKDGTRIVYDTYHAFEISEEGLNTTSVKSTFAIGPMQDGVEDIRGYLTLSPDGSKLASANARAGLYVYDFDTSTGIVANQTELFTTVQASYAYGVAFSPNSELLYVHASNDYFNQQNPQENNNPANHFSVLMQYNMLSDNIQSSAFILDSRNLYRGALQLGPDGKIYRALSDTYSIGNPYLGVISSPNSPGIGAGYRHNAVSLAPNESGQGLPPFIQSIFETDIDIINNGQSEINLTLCEGETYNLEAEAIPGATYQWFKNEIPISNDTNNLFVEEAGHYVLRIIPNNGDCPLKGQAYIFYNALPQASNSELIQCDVDGVQDGISIFNLFEAKEQLANNEDNRVVRFFETMEDAMNNTNSINADNYENKSNPQRIFAKVIDTQTRCGQIADLTLRTVVTETTDSTLIECDDDGQEDGTYSFNLRDADSLVYNGEPSDSITINYYVSEEQALLEKNPLPNNYRNETPDSQVIYARIENENACFGINRINLVVNQLPQLEAEETVRYCLNFFPETIMIDSGITEGKINQHTFIWSTGETTETINVNEIGTYTVSVTNRFGCSKERKVIVSPSDIATIDNIEVVDVSNNNTITIYVSGEGDYEFSLDDESGTYQDENLFENVSAGIHTIFVRDKNGCGIVQEKVSVIGFPKMFSPNDDGINDYWNVKGISQDFQPNTIIYIYDRYGKLLRQLNPLEKGWDGKFNGQILTSTDYWFSVKLEDGRLFKGHFSLRR